jgi:FkbM family methyltransferase
MKLSKTIKKFIWKDNSKIFMNQKNELDYVSSFINKDDIVIDVGSNTGDIVNYFLRKGHTVIFFEPDLKNFEKQSRRFKKYHRKQQVIMNNLGCSNKNGETILYRSKDTYGVFSTIEEIWRKKVFWSNYREEDTQKIKLIKLADYLNELPFNYIGFIKIDTEGHDYKVIEGLFDGLSHKKYPKYLQFEINTHPVVKPLLRRAFDILSQNGYPKAKYYIRHGNTLIHETGWESLNFDISVFDKWPSHPDGYRYGNVLLKQI